MARTPEGPPPPPVVQKLRLEYAKRGRLRFSSHRDFQRALERALRRAQVPMGYSAGFHPHPKISFANAAPTGTASEAEYLEIGLARACDPEQIRQALDESLPEGLDILRVVIGQGPALADRLHASAWLVELPGADAAALKLALGTFLAAEEVPVQRLTKNGQRTLDARAPVLRAELGPMVPSLELVVRHVTPTVRPAEVLAGLGVDPTQPIRATRLRQGPWLDGELGDPLAEPAALAKPNAEAVLAEPAALAER